MIPALAFSLVMIVLLWRGDPKRRRIAGLRDSGSDRTMRRLLVAAAVLPGVILAFSGDSAAFLIWFGGCALAGWLLSQIRPAPIKHS